MSRLRKLHTPLRTLPRFIPTFLRILITFLFVGGAILGSIPSDARNTSRSQYRFDLVKGKEREVCHHMHSVYNTNFRMLWKMGEPTNHLWMLMSKYHSHGPLYSLYPASPEFEAVKWDAREYIDPDGKPKVEGIALVARLDVDNDGKAEDVTKLLFYFGGYSEAILVMPDSKLSESRSIHYSDFNRKDKVVLGYAAILRPFVYRGTTYIHWYDFKRPESPDRRPDPNVNKKWILVRKYLGAGPYKEGYEPQYEDLCRFDVVDLEVERQAKNRKRKEK